MSHLAIICLFRVLAVVFDQNQYEHTEIISFFVVLFLFFLRKGICRHICCIYIRTFLIESSCEWVIIMSACHCETVITSIFCCLLLLFVSRQVDDDEDFSDVINFDGCTNTTKDTHINLHVLSFNPNNRRFQANSLSIIILIFHTEIYDLMPRPKFFCVEYIQV